MAFIRCGAGEPTINPVVVQTLTDLGAGAATRDIQVTLDRNENVFSYESNYNLDRAYTASGQNVTQLLASSQQYAGYVYFKVTGTPGDNVTVTLATVANDSRFGGSIIKLQ